MAEQRNFLLLAAGMGAIGVIIGGIIIWNQISELVT